jgi:Putative adhesin
METFGYWKTMNKHMKQFSSISAWLALAVIAAVILGTGAEKASGQGQTQTGGDRIPVTLSDPSRPARIKAGLINGGITVKAYEGKEVVVEARARNRESSREGGPKRLAIPLTTGLSVEEENNEVNVNTDSYMHPIDLAISVPVHTSLKLSAVNDGDIVVTGVDGELDVDDVNGSVTLNNVSGSAVAHALNGHLHATFTRVDPQKAMAFSSLNGDIDVTFPADLKANVSIRSDRGDVFSDFDVQLRAAASQPEVEDSRGHGGKYRVKIDKTVHGTINGGGSEIQFTNFQGQIYIRKAGNPR